MKRAALYARYSSDRQHERSIEDQFALLETVAQRQQLVIVARYADRAVSGAATVNRPQFLAMIEAAQRGVFEVVLVEDQNRAFRNQADYHGARERLDYFGVAIHDAKGPIGRVEGSFYAMMDAITLDKLAAQTRRGMLGAARAGRNAGGRAYGYRSVPGQPGALAIVEAEAAIVRRIFAEYIAGAGTREIVKRLNAEGVKPPRGGARWNQSALAGSRARSSGILFNALYDGRQIWNRQAFRKHPDSQRRIGRVNDRADWIETPVEQLRIVDARTFALAQARKAARGGPRGRQPVRPRHLLSGLVACGVCGGNYVAAGHDKRGTLLSCYHNRDTGTCDHKRRLPLAALERRVLAAVEAHLGSPELVREYVLAYHRAAASRRADDAKARTGLARKLAATEREAARLIDAIAKGTPPELVNPRLHELAAQRAALAAARDAVPATTVALHPAAADVYRRKIADLKAALTETGEARRAQAFAIVRELVERIVVKRTAPYQPAELEIHGRLATLLLASGASGEARRESGVAMVAGERYRQTRRPAFAFTIRL